MDALSRHKKAGIEISRRFGEELVQLVVAEQRCAVFEQRERFGLHLRKVLARQRGGFLLKLASIQGGSTILPNWATRRRRAGAKRRQPPTSAGGARDSPMQCIDWTAERRAD